MRIRSGGTQIVAASEIVVDMKKALLLTVLVGASFLAKAQLQQGNVLVGGDISNVNISLDNGGNYRIVLNPKAAWFIRDNFAIGAYLRFDISGAQGAGTNIGYGVGPLARYYFSQPAVEVLRKSRFFVEGNLGIGGDNPSVGDNTNGLELGIGPGISYFITPNIGLEALLKYDGIIGFGEAVSTNDLNFSIGFQIFLPSRRLRQEVREVTK